MRKHVGKRVIALAAACFLMAGGGQGALGAEAPGADPAVSLALSVGEATGCGAVQAIDTSTEQQGAGGTEDTEQQGAGGTEDTERQEAGGTADTGQQGSGGTPGAELPAPDAGQSEPDEGQQDTEHVKKPDAAYLDVDVRHSYPHMDSSYEQGYIPKVESDTVYLVVPLVADGELRDSTLTAELVMGDGAPFVYANYRKEIKKETYLFERNTDAYVFACEIGLEKRRINGKYPVDVRAHGYTSAGKRVEFSCRIFITISDGIDAPGAYSGNTSGPEGGNTSDPNGGNIGPTEPATEPAGGELITGDPSAQEPATEEPATEEPATEEPTSEGPAAEEPATEEPTADDPTADTPVIDPGSSDGGGGGSYYGGGESQEKVHRQPKLMLTENTLAGARLLAGQEQEFTLSLQNMNAEESVYNLMVSLKSEPDLSLSTTSFYFGVVYPKETIALTSVLSAASGAAAGKSTLSLSYEYENGQGNAYSGAQEFSVEVCQSVQAVMEGFSIADTVYAQETVESGVSVRNVGKTAIYNAVVELEAPGLFATESLFAGNLEAGASYEGNLRIYVGNKKMASISDAGAGTGDGEAYGRTTGTLTLTYENADGEIFKQTQEFATVIQEPQIVELHVQEEEEVRTNQWWAAILVMTVLLFLLVVVILSWRLKKSRNALEDLLAAKEGRSAY